MEAHLTEWLNLSIRWIHMIVGIAWIGASFYFVWLENNLERGNPREGLSGDLWAIHGGGIYHLEKYQLAPPQMPEKLHWFKWEAYSTWLSGVALLTLVYYLNPTYYLIAPGSALHPAVAVGIGLGSLLAGWIIYESLCDSALGKRPALLGLVLFVLLVYAAWGYAQLFSGRAAYIHVGALIGTLMVGNVFRVIIPAQRALVAAIQEGREPDPALPAKGLLRSRHNNYFTLPVLFTMISNHFPSTYGNPYNWLILAAIAAFGVLVRHYFNTRHAGQTFAWALPAAALGMVCLAYVSAPTIAPRPTQPVATQTPAPTSTREPTKTAESSQTSATVQDEYLPETPVTEPELPAEPTEPVAPLETARELALVQQIIEDRCLECHSASPSSPIFTSAPLGAMFDTPEQIQQMSEKIYAQAVATQVMPLGNLTQMTQEERDLLGDWIEKGARID
ncbi:urate hydroxylase PuuD [Pseudomonas sp.]|uniref:urate hydroxylase PuuD n=1 Tax=Pseudomonas sp. TaxID=306 RepID=UPI0019E1AC20|nr:urate hydroxylase PuuD [Pseudomonas sp.]MBF0676073.1 urate hydroxylase PuuD [Pseudomonas sp.]